MIFVASALYGEANRLGFLEFICKSHFFRISDHRAAQGYVVRCEGMIKATSELPDFFRLSLNELKGEINVPYARTFFHNTNLKKKWTNGYLMILKKNDKEMDSNGQIFFWWKFLLTFCTFPLIFCSSHKFTYFPEYVNISFW